MVSTESCRRCVRDIEPRHQCYRDGVTEALQGRLQALDTGLLEQIESQTSDDDKRTLLALQAALPRRLRQLHVPRDRLAPGGFAPVSGRRSPSGEAILSIDPRPAIVPDNRWEEGYEYTDNSTARMLRLLEGVPGANLNKLKTFEASTGDLSPQVITPAPHLCFIDGEHTNPAAARDADFCRSVVRVPGLIAFHDTPVVAPAIGRFLDHSGGFGYRLRDLVFVVEFGGRRIFNHPLLVERMTFHRSEWIWANRIGVAGRMVREASPVEAVRGPLPDPHAAAAIARPGVTLAPGGARVPGSAPDLAAALTTLAGAASYDEGVHGSASRCADNPAPESGGPRPGP